MLELRNCPVLPDPVAVVRPNIFIDANLCCGNLNYFLSLIGLLCAYMANTKAKKYKA